MRWAAEDPVLRNTHYFAQLQGKPSLAFYPGSPGWVIDELGLDASYLFCDIDPESLRELRAFAEEEAWGSAAEIADADGLATVTERVLGSDPHEWFVFIDPFDYHASIGDGPNAIDVATKMLASGVQFACWYGYDEADQRFWLPEMLADAGTLWAGDILTVTTDGSVHSGGNLGDGTTPGTGSGMAFGNIDDAIAADLNNLGLHLDAAYTHATLPSGFPGRLAFDARTW